MSRTDEEIIQSIKDTIDTRLQLAVEGHGGKLNFISYNDGTVVLELSGACSGCAGSTATLKNGIENMMKYFVPEVKVIEAVHDQNSTVEPYYKDTSINVINIKQV